VKPIDILYLPKTGIIRPLLIAATSQPERLNRCLQPKAFEIELIAREAIPVAPVGQIPL
jgi:hypothetical protein